MRYPELAIEFGKKIIHIRTNMSMGVTEFAIHCHIDHSSLYDIEAGKQCPCLFSVMKICHYTNTDYNLLLKELEPLIADKYDCKKVK